MSEEKKTLTNPCRLCGNSEATKTNSHIVPSFLVAQFASYDSSYKRDKELMFSISPSGTKVYTGALPTDKIESTFDASTLSDERIEKELKDNFESEDFILCPECESDLSKFLETPYADTIRAQKAGDGELSYFFWLSIIWRMCISSRDFGFDLPSDTVNQLHDMLFEYIQRQKGAIQRESTAANAEVFKYQLFICPDYCKQFKNGCQYCRLDDNVLTFIVGDEVAVCYFNNRNSLPENYAFPSLTDIVTDSPFNNGEGTENRVGISPEKMTAIISDFKFIAVRKVISTEADLIAGVWFKLGIAPSIPLTFIKAVIERFHSDITKIGDRGTVKNLAESFQYCLQHPDIWNNSKKES